jgi:hypothetical protein
MTKFSTAISFVFDSFIMPPGPNRTRTEGVWNWDPVSNTDYYTQRTVTERSPALMVLVPGIRWHTSPNNAFQFGFTGAYYDGEFAPVPIPMVQWFRKI